MNPQTSQRCPGSKTGDPACHVFVTLSGGITMQCVQCNGVFPLATVSWERMIPLVDTVVQGLRAVVDSVGPMELRPPGRTPQLREALIAVRDAWADLCGVLLQCAERGTMDDAVQVAAVLGVVRGARVAADEAANSPLCSSVGVALRVAEEVLTIMRETHGRALFLAATAPERTPPTPPPPEHKRENLN